MRQTVLLIINGLKDINRALNKPLRFLILSLIASSIMVVALLCCIIAWQRKDMATKDARIKELERTVTFKDSQITGLQNKLLDYLFTLNAEVKHELEEFKRKKP